MSNVDKMREEAKKLVSECRFVVGYERGTFNHLDRALIAKTPEDVDKFVFGPTSIPNLTLYAVTDFRRPLKRGESPDARPIGIVCKGCDAKTIVELVREHIHARDQVKIIGMPCKGTIDPKKFAMLYGEDNDVKQITWGPDGFLVDGQAPKGDLLAGKCLHCKVRNPSVTDVDGMEQVDQPEAAGFEGIESFEAMDPEDRWRFFEGQFSKCIRCYACRNACPLCYCHQCSIDIQKPFNWTQKFTELPDNTFYHTMRALHLAGRCVDCGECERVCPMDIPLRLLNGKMAKVAYENFNIESGEDPDRPSLLGGCDPNDKECFIW